MSQRVKSQKAGARGHRWLASIIEEHPHWLARDLGEDYGIDLEAELTENGVRGEILKIQIKSSDQVERDAHRVRAIIERKYLEYAELCRYPVIFVVVDVSAKEAWYVWIQDWLLNYRSTHGELDRSQASWTHWIPIEHTFSAGLDSSLKTIARWEGETQLAISLMDALRSAASVYNGDAITAITNLIMVTSPRMASAPVDIIVREALRLGDRLRATNEGNIISNQLFSLMRHFGGRISRATVLTVVCRGESCSRVGLAALGILYDEHFDYMRSLGLPNAFEATHPAVAYYCAYREAHPDAHSDCPFADPKDFTFAGLRYIQPDRPWDKYANRGPSALIECLVPVEYVPPKGNA